MILYLEFSNEKLRFGLIGSRTAKWFSSRAVRQAFKALAAAKEKLSLKRRPSCVVCAMAKSADSAFKSSWSTVRAEVAMANGLAFAWGLPVAEVRISGEESPEELARAIRKAAVKAKPGHWVQAKYSGEPNITKPKKRP